MKKTQTKKTSILSVLCYILAALFFLYGVYMLIYSIDYIQSYESTGLIDTQNVIQYVVTSSASYLGFAVLLFAAGSVIRMLKNMQPALIGTITETEEVEETKEAETIEETAQTEKAEEAVAIEETTETAETVEMPAEGDAGSDSDVQPHVPEIGNTSSALTFHELIIDLPQDAAEETKADSEEPVKSEKANEKISSSMIRDIFEQK
ncbi:MAG: hypothetical protein ACLTD7_03075 [Clostridia bacterium]